MCIHVDLFSGMDSLTRKKCYATLTSFLDLQEYPYDGVVRKRGQASPDEASAEGASLTVLWLLRLLQVLLVKVLCVCFFLWFLSYLYLHILDIFAVAAPAAPGHPNLLLDMAQTASAKKTDQRS